MSLAVLATNLDEDESVEALVQGRLYGNPGVCALTDKRVILVNEREHNPDVVSIELGAGLEVGGWVDNRLAVLEVTRDASRAVLDQIKDGDLARGFADAVRSKVS